MAAIGPICQACGGAIGSRPATAAIAPNGKTTWWLHRDTADCVQALSKERRKAA